MHAAAILAFTTGFLSLSQEILWVRLFGFANHSIPHAFSFVLVFYLLGIAIGAYIGKGFCNVKLNPWKVSGELLIFASFLDLFSPWIYAFSNNIFIAGYLIFLTALFKAILFPIAHYLGTLSIEHSNGRHLSRIYAANIAGATLGPLFTGLVLLDFLTTQHCFVFVAICTFILGLYCLSHSIRVVSFVLCSLLMVSALGIIFKTNPSLLIGKLAANQGPIKKIIEDKHGIITIYADSKTDNKIGGDVIAGGNVFDGSTSLDPTLYGHSLSRLLVLLPLHQKPEHVLMIGLSIGTWLKLLVNFPHVKSVDVIEINPAYLSAIKDYPQQNNAITDSRVHIHIDDATRWLKNHPDKQYDLMVMNSTYHWRAYSTNLLSKEFISLMKQHLKPNGVLSFNTTFSPDSFKTASALFPHAYRYRNFVIAADFDWRKKLHDPLAKEKLASFELDGKPFFYGRHKKQIALYLNEPIITIEEIEAICKNSGRKVEIITNNNLIPEYKYGKTIFNASFR